MMEDMMETMDNGIQCFGLKTLVETYQNEANQLMSAAYWFSDQKIN